MSHGRHRKPTNTARNAQRISTSIGGASLLVVMGTVTQPVAATDVGPWGPIIECESGGQNIENGSSTASGYFQIIDSTWRGAGGLEFAPRAIEATFEEQLIVAERIRAARGSYADWDASRSCWEGDVEVTPIEEAPLETPAPPPVVEETPPPPAVEDAPTEEIPIVGQVTVEPGDTLSGLAIEHGLPTWRELYDENVDVVGADPDLIFPDQVLDVPSSGGRHRAPEPEIETEAQSAPAPEPVQEVAPAPDPTEGGTVVAQATLPPVPAADAPVVTAPTGTAAQIAVATALAQVGDPYVWAGAGPDSFDCSGLVQYAYKVAGISLPHSSSLQAQQGVAVARADLQPGDLVGYPGHVGIYIGDGRVVQAANPQDDVVVKPIDWAGTPTSYRRL